MTTTRFIALLRGVNIGGRNKLPMKALAATLENIGFRDVRTYIQSGNLVFDGDGDPAALGDAITAAIGRDFGFRPWTHVLTAADLREAATANPYPAAEAEGMGKTLHLNFLSADPERLDPAGLDALADEGEGWTLIGRIFYLHTPNGFGTSKLAMKSERFIGVPGTARNWNTIRALLEMAGETG